MGATIHLLFLLILVTPKTYGEKGPRRYKPDGSEEGKEGKADPGVSKEGKEGKGEGKKGGSWEEEELPWLEGKQGECVFTHDCLKNVSRCTEIQDVGCSCLFGKCEMGEPICSKQRVRHLQGLQVQIRPKELLLP